MKVKGNVTQYEDYKYVMQDTGNVYIGAVFTYEELIIHEMTPFKLKTIITRYILKETNPDTTLESELYFLKSDCFLFEIFNQLKMKIKIQIQEEKKTLLGKKRIQYVEKILTLSQLTELNLARKKAAGVIVQEIIISKLALMTFNV